MSTDLEVLVDRVFSHLRQLGSMIPSRRRAGLKPESIKKAMHDQRLEAPDELIALYAYCDGTSTQEGEILGSTSFFSGFYWMSIDDALEAYRGVSTDAEWGGSWLPIFANGGGDFYAVVCDSASPYFGEVVGFVRGETDQIVEFKSVGTLLETVERSFAEGAFFIAEGLLKADYPRMRAIAREVQPGFVEHEV